VRSFGPFFEPARASGASAERDEALRARPFELVTSGAYAIVRHPIYAAGLYFQLERVAALVPWYRPRR
jgi:protein-S-isoprenylcysteine O-methyltransferase Ste14